jgi:hypothetical protein
MNRNVFLGFLVGAIAGLSFGADFGGCTSCHGAPEARAHLTVRCGQDWLEGAVKGDEVIFDAIVESLDGNSLGENKPDCHAYLTNVSYSPTH